MNDELFAWGNQNGYGKTILQQHLDYFKDAAAARGYQYADWNAAFRNAVKADWAGLSTVAKSSHAPTSKKAPFQFITKHDAITDKNRIAKEQFLAMKRKEAAENAS